MILTGAEDREVRQHDLKSCETVKVSGLPFSQGLPYTLAKLTAILVLYPSLWLLV